MTIVTRLCLVRHGETAWNAEGRVQGQTDIPLSEVGQTQAIAAARALAAHDFSALYSSDLLRVRQTAEPAARQLALPVNADERLRERHYGIFERLLYTEVRDRFPAEYDRFRTRDPGFDFGTGESLSCFSERSLAVVAEIAARHPGEQVLVFTHGGVLEMVHRHANASGLSTPRDFGIPNAGLNWIEVSGDRWRVTTWADVSHLASSLDDLRS